MWRKRGFTTLCLKQISSRNSLWKGHGYCFLRDKRFILINYLKKGKTITNEFPAHPLNQLDEKNHETRPGLQNTTIIFHRVSAPAQKGSLTVDKLKDLKYELM